MFLLDKDNSKELSDIKKLLMLIATKYGANSKDIGKLLGVDSSRIRQILRGSNKKNRGEINE